MLFDKIRRVRRGRETVTGAATILMLALLCGSAASQPSSLRPPVLRDVNIDQLLNNQVPLDLVFRDETGKDVRLQDYFKDKPVIQIGRAHV